jgi:NAD(P)-dependent dehydrogenase (short-subunit alcohol dehydrogenase family)
MGRFASPQDVARAILFLADPVQSGFINGATLTVDWRLDRGRELGDVAVAKSLTNFA